MNINPHRLHFDEKAFDSICKELRELLFERGSQYNKKSLVYDYFPFIPESFDTMLYIKTLRELNKEDQTDFDSLKDLIIYTMFKWYYFKKAKEILDE